MCAPPDEEFAELLAGVGVPLVPFGQPWRSWVRPSAAEERTRRVAEFIAAQFPGGPVKPRVEANA